MKLSAFAAYVAFVLNLVAAFPAEEIESSLEKSAPYAIEDQVVHTEDKSAFVKAENWVMVVLVLAIVGAVGFGFWYFFKKGKADL